MGRTYRKRRRKSQHKLPSNLGSAQYFVQLIQWMKQHDWTSTCKLSLAEFGDTGRGLKTEEMIAKNQVIASIPAGRLITVPLVAASDIGWLFKTNSGHLFAQDVLATFLVWEKHLEHDSAWRPYINTLPSHYSMPLFCSQEELAVLPTIVSKLVEKQKLKCLQGFDAITTILSVSVDRICRHCRKQLSEVFNYKAFEWAWCTVNTRCVYINENSCKHDLGLKDEANIALAPFLDMFNHSNEAQVEVSLSANNYEIKTLVPFSKYSQVFIQYGHHSNLKLYTEYGFVLSSNCHDFLSFSFEEVLSCVRNQREIKDEKLKVDFLTDHNLTQDLSCNCEDISFNMKAVIYVLGSSETRKRVMTQKIYSSQFDQHEIQIICDVTKQMIQHKCRHYESILKTMNDKISRGCSNSFLVGYHLMLMYLQMLKSCLSSATSMLAY